MESPDSDLHFGSIVAADADVYGPLVAINDGDSDINCGHLASAYDIDNNDGENPMPPMQAPTERAKARGPTGIPSLSPLIMLRST